MQDVAFKNTFFFIFWKWKLCKGNPILYLISGKIKMFLNQKKLPERYKSILPALKNGTPIRLNIIKLLEKSQGKNWNPGPILLRKSQICLGLMIILFMNYSRKHFMRKRIWIHRCMYSRKIIMQLLLMKPIRNFWQKYWQIQRCGRCSIHWQRRWSNKFYIQMSIFIVHMENLSPSNLLKSPSFSIKMMEIDWQRVTIGWSSPKH